MDPFIVSIIVFAVDMVKILVIATVLMLAAAMAMPLVERKLVGRFTLRYGPNRVGPFGLLQPIADTLKMFFKEELVPGHVDRWVYLMAPGITLVPVLLVFAVIPLARDSFILPFSEAMLGSPIIITPWIANINVGILYMAAIGSLATYGIILGGWSSNNKYSLLGGLRTSAQMVSYELPLGTALLSVVLVTGTMRIWEIVEWQSKFGGLAWLVFLQPIAFLIFFISSLAEAGRSPFDLPETENELIGGFITEYGGMKFALFFGAEYLHTILLSSVATALFLGGWNFPVLGQIAILQPFIFIAKVMVMLFTIIWIRTAVPRLRFDKLMAFSWKFMLPLGLLNLMVTALLLAILFF